MLPVRSTSDIFNGARCKGYSWSQRYDDLEIRIKLSKDITHKHLNIALSKREICVELSLTGNFSETLIKGNFEHEIDLDSAYWLLEKEDGTCLVVYMDKIEELWWRRLLVDEEPIEMGPREYTVPMNQIDEGSRMAIEKLVTDQKRKLLAKDDQLSPA